MLGLRGCVCVLAGQGRLISISQGAELSCVCNDIEIKERLKLETRLLNQIRWVSKVRDSYTKTKINKYYEPDMNCDCEIQRKNSTGFSLLADGIMDKKRVYIHLIRRSLSKETAVEKRRKNEL